MSSRREHNKGQHDDLFDQLDRWGTFILANLFWAMLALPLITLPAATVGFFATLSRWVRGKNPELFHVFFGAMRHYWLKSTLVGLLDVVVGGLLAFNFSIFPMMDMANPVVFLSRSVTFFVGLLLVLVNLHLWTLIAIWDAPLRDLFSLSLKLVFIHPLWSLGLLIAAAIPIFVGLMLPPLVLLFGVVSCSVYVASWGTWYLLKKHLSPAELTALDN